MIVKTDHPQYVKDTKSNAILNKDIVGLEAYRNRKERSRQQDQRLNTLEERMQGLEYKLDLILNLLKER